MPEDRSDPNDERVLRDVLAAVAQRTNAAPRDTTALETAPPQLAPDVAAPHVWGRDSAERRPVALVAAAVAAAAVVIIAVGFVVFDFGDPRITTVGTVPRHPVVSEYPASPVPPGWQTVDYGDLRFSVAGDWAVLRQPDRGGAGGCPTASKTVALGGGPADCPPVPGTPSLVRAARLSGDCDASFCGEKSSAGAIRPDTPITRTDTVNGLRIARLEHSAGACDACLAVAAPDLGITVSFARIDEATVLSILNTFDRSARWRALHDGPLADTSSWQTVDATPAVSAPGDWRVQRVGGDPAAHVPWRCTDGFADTDDHTVVIDEQPVDMMTGCGKIAVGAPVDAIYLRPSLQDVYDLTRGDSTTSNGATITVLPDIFPGTSTIEVRIDTPGQSAVRASIGVSADPLIARTILRRLGRASQPAVSPPTSAPGTTVDPRTPEPSSALGKGTRSWLVPLDRLVAPSSTNGTPGTSPRPIEPPSTRLGAEDPFVAAVTGLVPEGFTLKAANRIDTVPPKSSATFTSGPHVTLVASSQRITGPVAPVLMSDDEFDAAHTQAPDGTEVVIDVRNLNAVIAVYLATPDGRLITLAVASDAPAIKAQPITMEQATALARAIEQSPIPG